MYLLKSSYILLFKWNSKSSDNFPVVLLDNNAFLLPWQHGVQLQEIKFRSPEMKSDQTMARRMTLIVLTDFFCWVPIILLGVASLFGATIQPQVWKIIAVYIDSLVMLLNELYNKFYFWSLPIRDKIRYKNPRQNQNVLLRQIFMTSFHCYGIEWHHRNFQLFSIPNVLCDV